MMKKLCLLLIVPFVLVACATQSMTPIQGVGQVTTASVPTALAGKFAMGPHKGLLNTRQYYFDCSSTLMPNSTYAALNAHAAYLKKHPSAQVELQGFTYAKGSHEYNITVGQTRADSIRDYLALHGARINQLTAVSYGEEQDYPLGDNAGNPENCRVDLIYTQA